MPNRAKAQQTIIDNIEKLAGASNAQLYKTKFSQMSDDEFHQFMSDIKEKKVRLCIIAPNFSSEKLSSKKCIEVAKGLGKSLFQRIWISAEPGKPAFLTPNTYMVPILPLRRQAQLLSKKISIPEDNNSVDDFTGQPTGKSKGSKLSYPELQVLASFNLSDTITELIKYRGGDEKGFAAMNTMIDRHGQVSLKEIAPYASGVKSTQTLKAMLTAMHFKVDI